MLNNILLAISSKKPCVSDLERNSGAVQSINDGFRHYCKGLELRSFYETIKTNIGVSSLLIVSKDSATLGYPNEQSALLNATHRSICKFDSPSDPNFVTLRNALVTTTRNITEKGMFVAAYWHQDVQIKISQRRPSGISDIAANFGTSNTILMHQTHRKMS